MKNRIGMRRRRRDRFFLGALIGLTLIGLFAGLRVWDPTPVERIRHQTFDFFQRLAPREPPDAEQMARVKRTFGEKLPELDIGSEFPVAIIDIDENSLRAFGQWPWPRTRLAELVDRLTSMGAVAIAFDAIFPEDDRMSPGNFMREVPTLDKETRAMLATLPSNDQLMADAMRRSNVVLGQSGVRGDVVVEAAPEKTSIALIGDDPTPHLVKFPKLLPNVATLEAAAAGRGLVSIRPERDGAVRRIPAVMAAGGRIAPALSMELLRVALNETTILVRTTSTGVQNIVIGSTLPVPTDENGQLWVHFAPQDPGRYIPARDVLLGATPADAVDGKLVLIGASAIGLLDRKTTAIDSGLPGVEVHAQMLETILTGAQLVRPDYALGLELVAAVVAGLFIVALAPRLSALALMSLGMVLAAGFSYAAWHAFTEQQLLFDVTYPLLSSFAIFAILMFYNYVREERERDWIRGAFGRYLAPDVVERMAVDDRALELGGESRRLTLLFSDVRGFTGISEQYRDDPQGLTALMNRFLTPLSNAIIERSGTIDKYMGDAIMAFWNAPLDVANHEVRACEAALDMRRRLDALNAERQAEAEAAGQPFRPIDVGVGLNTGVCVVGNMGSELRFDYSVLGDTVNLASRFEGLTAQYRVEVLVGPETAAACGDRMALIEIDRIIAKGKSEPQAMFALIGDGQVAAGPAFARLKGAFAAMLAAYRAQAWEEAEMRLAEAREADAEARIAGLLDVFAERIAAFRHDPPPAEWDGVFAATRK